jgi:hypothetical protein
MSSGQESLQSEQGSDYQDVHPTDTHRQYKEYAHSDRRTAADYSSHTHID